MTAAQPRYACVWTPGFAAAALIRQDPALQKRPVAALRGATIRTVVAVTADAAAGGARAGMSATEAATRVPDLVARMEDPVAERVAAGALLDAAWATSPRVEVVEPGRLCLDLGGLAPLFGNERRIGERLIAAGAAVGLPVRVGIGGTRTLARLAARVAAPLRVVPPGAEEAFLAPCSLGLLEPEPDLGLAFERWGIGTLGALAALPTAALLARLGPPAVRLQALARGTDLGPFVPHLEPEPCREAITLDWEVPSLPALAFILDRLLAQLAARLALREAGAAALRGGQNLSPWSKRVTGQVDRLMRFEGDQILPGDQLPPADAGGLLLNAMNIAPKLEAEFNEWYDKEHIPALSAVTGVLCARRFRGTSGTSGNRKYVARSITSPRRRCRSQPSGKRRESATGRAACSRISAIICASSVAATCAEPGRSAGCRRTLTEGTPRPSALSW